MACPDLAALAGIPCENNAPGYLKIWAVKTADVDTLPTPGATHVITTDIVLDAGKAFVEWYFTVGTGDSFGQCYCSNLIQNNLEQTIHRGGSCTCSARSWGSIVADPETFVFDVMSHLVGDKLPDILLKWEVLSACFVFGEVAR